MTALSAKITGTDKLKKQLNRLSKNARKAALEALTESAISIHSEAVKLINKTSPGMVVRRRGTNHVVSKPGDAPNTDTGRLIQSIQFEVRESALTALVGTNLKYGVFLEFGTETMAARPWLSTAIKSKKKDIGRRFQVELNSVIRKEST